MIDELSKNIESLLKEAGFNGKVNDLEPLTNGASNETWKFNFSENLVLQKMILKKGPDTPSSLALPKSKEAEIQKIVFKEQGPVPNVLAISNEKSSLKNAYIMMLVEGESIPRKILRDDTYKQIRDSLAFQCGQAMAKIHQVPLNSLSWLDNKDITQELEELYLTYEKFKQPQPVFEYTFRWLRNQDFGDFPNTLIHADFRLGNLIFDKNGLQSVIDWELAHIGNPLQDLGWICVNSWRFGKHENVVGGFGEIEDLLNGYNSIIDIQLDVQQIKNWQIFGTLRWGVICLIQTFAHLLGPNNSVERAAIGRRVSETELDLVDLLFMEGK